MTNLNEAWAYLEKQCLGEFKKNYYAELLNVGVSRSSKFKVYETDLDKEFHGPLIDLVAGKDSQDKSYKSIIKILRKGESLAHRAKYTIMIFHEEGDKGVDFLLIGGKKELLGEDIDAKDVSNFDKFHYKIPKSGMLLLKSWTDVLYGFGRL